MRLKFFVGALSATVASATLISCGSGSGPSTPVGGGGGTSPVGSQTRSGLFSPAKLLDGGTSQSGTAAYSGANVAATEAETANNAGSDTLFNGTTSAATTATPAPYAVPANPIGTHLITFNGNGLPQQIFRFNSQLLMASTILSVAPTPGQTSPTNYAGVVFFAATSLSNATYDLEITGGSGSSQYDVRTQCVSADLTANPSATSGAIGSTTFTRFVCPLPAYGALSGSYATTSSLSTGGGISGATFVSPAIPNAVVPGATGVFTPTGPALPGTTNGNTAGTPLPVFDPTIYVVLDESVSGSTLPSPPPTTETDTLEIDYMYAEGILR